MRFKTCTAYRAFLSLLVAVFFSTHAFAQPESMRKASSAISVKKAISKIARQKNLGQSVVLLTPSDLLAFSRQEIGLLTSNADPCEEALPIHFSQSLIGALTNTDCQLADGSYADFYFFEGLAGEQIQIDMASADFDSYLAVSNESGTWTLEDDDGGGGTNSRITATLPESGTFIILANSFDPNVFGAYSLRLLGGPQCSFQFNPSSVDIPHTAGTYTFEVITGPRCYWAAGSTYSQVSTTSEGLGSGIVTYSVTANPTNQIRTASIGIRGNYFYARQAPLPCNYSFSSTWVSVGPTQTTGSFTVTAQQGCSWSANSQSRFISATGSANGNGTVNYTVEHNNGYDRSGFILVGGTAFTVNQTGLDCSYSVSPTSVNLPAAGGSGTYGVTTQPGCSWGLTRNQNWIQVQPAGGYGSATVQFTVAAQTERSTRWGVIQLSYGRDGVSHSISTYINQAARLGATVADFDGDSRSDISIYRPSVGEWWISRSSSSTTVATQFGSAGDIIAPGDFTGDGKIDVTFWRPSTGEWYILRSENNTLYGFPFGTAGDVPVPADYDGDGKADVAVFRPSVGLWYISRSSDGLLNVAHFGITGDVPVSGDFDGDGKADIAIFRPSGGEWWIQCSTSGLRALQFGAGTDKAVSADYTGDGKTDIAFWRPTTGEWFVMRSENSSYYAFRFGSNGDIPVPGDYDGDGTMDIAVFRPANAVWYIRFSTGGVQITGYGLSGDRPVASAYIP